MSGTDSTDLFCLIRFVRITGGRRIPETGSRRSLVDESIKSLETSDGERGEALSETECKNRIVEMMLEQHQRGQKQAQAVPVSSILR